MDKIIGWRTGGEEAAEETSTTEATDKDKKEKQYFIKWKNRSCISTKTKKKKKIPPFLF